MNVILAHDSFTQLGGAEKVVDILHEIFPQAPVYTLVLDQKLSSRYKGWDVHTSTLQLIYNFYGHFQRLLILIPWAVDSLVVSPFMGSSDPITADKSVNYQTILLSSSSGFIKGIRKPKEALHINYCHTPTRFLWSDFDYVKQEVPFLLRPFARYFLSKMKKWDYSAAQRVDFFIANSQEVQKRIKEYYKRDSAVIYPGIDTEFWSLQPLLLKKEEHPPQEGEVVGDAEQYSNPSVTLRVTPSLNRREGELQNSNYFLLAGRLQAHKKNDLIVEIFNELNLPLHVVGTGRQDKYLQSIAKPNITFYGRVTDEQLREQYRGAQALIYPQIEDFGLMPLEAAACGTATIAFAQGGSLETIVPGVTGELFQNYNKDEIKKIILNWNPQKYGSDQLRAQAEKFNQERFKQKIQEYFYSL